MATFTTSSELITVPAQDKLYRYKPLLQAHDAIRLLLLEPHDDLEAPVTCSLIDGTLSQYEGDMIDHYTALSYVWGDASITKPVVVDGKVLHVTTNLESALRHMRDPKRKRLIWADAICINQADNDEKSHQVAQMARVYAVAQHTIIFLGEGSNESDALLTSLSNNKLQAHDINKSYLYDGVLKRPWFQRIWVYQELMASRDPWIQCGLLRIRWNTLA